MSAFEFGTTIFWICTYLIIATEQFYHFQLDLTLKDKKGGDISSFIPNGEWDLIGKYNSLDYT